MYESFFLLSRFTLSVVFERRTKWKTIAARFCHTFIDDSKLKGWYKFSIMYYTRGVLSVSPTEVFSSKENAMNRLKLRKVCDLYTCVRAINHANFA